MTGIADTQLYLAIGVPVVLNGVITALAFTLLMRHIDTCVNDMRELWRAELRRVEEVFDARLSHIEEKLGMR